jgi:hypothetical protein
MTSVVTSNAGFERGGLGNQLFKIAAIIDYAIKYNKIPIICNLKKNYYNDNEGMFLLNNFFTEFTKNKLNTVTIEQLSSINFTKFAQKHSRIYEDFPNVEGNVYINGYLESYKFISDNTRNIMNELITSNNNYVQIAKSLFNIIKEHFNDYDDDNYIFLHIRRGDIHDNNKTYIDYDYVKKAYHKIKDLKKKDNMNVIVFSDNINWCYDNINFLPNTYYLDNISNVYIELILMSMINNGILISIKYIEQDNSYHRSTLSWWGAFLGNKNKIITIPDKIGEDIQEYYLPEWILVE